MTEKNGKEGQNFVSWVFWYGMQLGATQELLSFVLACGEFLLAI
jgi:hypothetical protein